MNNLEIFNEIRAKLNNLVEANKGLKIKGIEDKEGYEKVKQAKNELRKEEIELEKLAKLGRQQALKWQRSIISLEKDLTSITSPVIEDYKKQLSEIDEIKAIEERKVLLPDRKKQLEVIEETLSDEDILKFNEKDWAELINMKRDSYLEAKQQEKLEKERKEQEEKRIEEAKKQAVENERKRIEKEEEKEREREVQKILDKKAEQEAQLKDAKIQDWLKANNYNQNEDKLYNEGNKMTLYKKVSELEIK
jgi:hypothetical protein